LADLGTSENHDIPIAEENMIVQKINPNIAAYNTSMLSRMTSFQYHKKLMMFSIRGISHPMFKM